MKTPQNFIPGQMRQALAKSIDKRCAGNVEIFRDQFVEQGGILGGQNRAQPDKSGLAVFIVGNREGRTNESVQDLFELRRPAVEPESPQATACALNSIHHNAADRPRKAVPLCRGNNSRAETS